MRFALCVACMSCVSIFGSQRADARSTVVVVLDDSGSMDEVMRSARPTRKITAAKRALISVLEQLPDDSRIGILLLNGQNSGSNWLVPLGPVRIAEARAAIAGVSAWGGTPLGEFMKVGTDALLQARSKEFYGDYRLLVVTDGEATDGDLLEQYLPDIMSRGVTVDVIGVDLPGEHSLATQVDSYRRADDPASLTLALKEVFAETSVDVSDAGGDDYALLEGLPDEVAVAVLTALATSGNEPIGTVPAPDSAGQNSNSRDTGLPGQRRAPPKDNARWSFWILVVVAYLLVRLLRTVMRGGRRKS